MTEDAYTGRPFLLRVSLSLKLLGVVVLALALRVIPSAYWSLGEQQAALEDAYTKKSKTLGQLLDAMIVTSDDLHDEAALFTQLQRFLWHNPDILHISRRSQEGFRTHLAHAGAWLQVHHR